MSTAIDSRTLWYIEFRVINPWDYHTPMMYIPDQRTYVRGASQDDATNEVRSWADPGGRVDITACERAPEWMQKP